MCLFAVSCEKDNKESEKNEIFGDKKTEFKLGEIKRMNAIEWADTIFGVDASIKDKEVLEAKRNYLNRVHELEDSIANANGENGVALFVGYTTFYYWSVDELGNPIVLSAFMGWGEHWAPFVGYFPMDQNHIRLVCPYTHTKEEECATKDQGGKEFLTMGVDDLFIMPDGEGFGATAGRDQLYLNHDVQARQIYDALNAGWYIYHDNIDGEMEDDWTLRVYGASQGAADAIAVHKFLDTQWYTPTQRMCDAWRFEYSFVCCGPYDPAKTMQSYYSTGYVTYPLVLPLTVKSMRASYPDLAAKYPESRFYSDKYNQNKAYFDDLVTNKRLTADDLNEKLCDILHAPGESGEKLRLERILSSEVLDKNSQIYKDFIGCLEKQKLTSGWAPRTKTYLWMSSEDEVVPEINSWDLRHLFDSYGKCASFQNMGFGHVACCAIYMVSDW